MMEPKTKSLLPLLLLLGFSCLLALGTVQASRSLASGTQELNHQKLTQEPPALSIADQDAMEEQLPAVEEAFVRGRMDIQSFNDYPGSGANNRHDPKPPRSG
uniref:Laminin subunit gamma-3 n=1 Tax=Anthurium amnicola TaxID=1678845 RepID=A0A1D1Y071_9ARAE